MLDITFAGAALAGLITFFTPCILPIVPFYLCYMAGISMTELRDDTGIAPGAQRRLIVSAVFFALGVTTIFVLYGMGATAVGQAFADYLDALTWVAVAILVIFGLHFLGVVRIGLLYREARVESKMEPTSILGAYLMGLAFGFGWTPCAGPAITAMLFIATTMGEVWRGGLLMLVYGLGMTAPFVVAALFSGSFLRWTGRHRDKLKYAEKVMGGMMLLFAVLIATGSVNAIGQWMIETFPGWTSLS